MRASGLVKCIVSEEGIIQIEALRENKIQLLGCSFPVSAIQSDDTKLDAISIEPAAKKIGLLAIRVVVNVNEGSGKNRFMQYFSFLLRINHEYGKHSIDLDQNFIPKPRKLVQIDGYNGHLMIQVDGETFISAHCYTPEKNRKPSLHYEVDGNLICKYAIGDISADEFKQQVSSWREEQSAKERVKGLEAELERIHLVANGNLESLKADLRTLCRELESGWPFFAKTTARSKISTILVNHSI